MKTRRLHRIMMQVVATLIMIAPMLWIGQAISGEQTVRVYKNPT